MFHASIMAGSSPSGALHGERIHEAVWRAWVLKLHPVSQRVDEILRYHERTKHHPGRYAAALGYMDWETQPDPFRRF